MEMTLVIIASIFVWVLIIGLISPKVVIRWGNNYSRKYVFKIYGSITFILFFLFVLFADNNNSKNNESSIDNKNVVQAKNNIESLKIKYSILDEKITDNPGKTQIQLKVLISGEINIDNCKKLLRKLFSDNFNRTGFKYHNTPTNLYFYLFTSEKSSKILSQWVGMLDWLFPAGQPNIGIREDVILNLGKKPEIINGLSLEKRKQIFKELVLAQDVAYNKAEKKYPLNNTVNIKKMAAYRAKLESNYVKKIYKKYNITEKIDADITGEAVLLNWPMPK